MIISKDELKIQLQDLESRLCAKDKRGEYLCDHCPLMVHLEEGYEGCSLGNVKAFLYNDKYDVLFQNEPLEIEDWSKFTP